MKQDANSKVGDALPRSPRSALRSLPLMKTLEDASALCEREQDGFYLTAFALQSWVANLVVLAAAEYAEKKNARERSMQTGQAWRGFLEIFKDTSGNGFPRVVGSLFRFAGYDDPMA